MALPIVAPERQDMATTLFSRMTDALTDSAYAPFAVYSSRQRPMPR
jgi:hypothetical protein